MKNSENLALNNLLENLEQKKAQVFKNMAVIPLFFNEKHRSRYLTLAEAMKSGHIDVFEKDHSGTVPELRVVNKSGKKVLIVDAEELAGAKQNRILNTSILLKKHSETIIPVSCTESGRWNYTSNKFHDSENIAIPNMRSKKAASVSNSLNFANTYLSNQTEVWDGVEELIQKSKMNSPTRSMKDVYDRKKSEVNDYMEAFRIKDKQKGFIVLIDGNVVGLEYISYHKAFRKLYSKILKSYAIQAHLQYAKTVKKVNKKSGTEFIARINASDTAKFKSPGHGYDHRITGKDLTGNILIYRKEVIHFAAFNNKNEKRNPYWERPW